MASYQWSRESLLWQQLRLRSHDQTRGNGRRRLRLQMQRQGRWIPPVSAATSSLTVIGRRMQSCGWKVRINATRRVRSRWRQAPALNCLQLSDLVVIHKTFNIQAPAKLKLRDQLIWNFEKINEVNKIARCVKNGWSPLASGGSILSWSIYLYNYIP